MSYSSNPYKAIYSQLNSLFSGRVYPDLAPPKTVLPYATVTLVNANPVNWYGGSEMTSYEMQVDVWASTRDQSFNYANGVKDILHLQQNQSMGGQSVELSTVSNVLSGFEGPVDGSAVPAKRSTVLMTLHIREE